MKITSPQKISNYYEALLNRDERFVGIFFAGVRTTSVFCISTCRARKPKAENVEFFSTFKDALASGYRPCKICKPTENACAAPPAVEQAVRLVKESPKAKISDYELRQNDISPNQVRRWFKKNYGMTFHAYQRMYRINNAFQELKHGKKTTHAAFDSGYDSLSGFGYTYKKLLGESPQKRGGRQVILINRLTTPLGPMFVCATEQGLCLLEFTDRRMLETEFKDLQRLLNARILIGENEHIIQARQQIAEYFEGSRKVFSLSLHTPGTDFQNMVWQHLTAIPYGATSTYQAQAASIGKPKAIRALASANGFNRLAIVVPCHRVIGKDGALRGYGGGLERKRWLLDFEKSNGEKGQKAAVAKMLLAGKGSETFKKDADSLSNA
ncbi:MAG: methylated-DNA--[protein]-cysteine S-methyltransferase [Bacteroidota bacterium]